MSILWGGIDWEMPNQQLTIFAYIPDPREAEEYERLKGMLATQRTAWQTARLSYLRDKLQIHLTEGTTND